MCNNKCGIATTVIGAVLVVASCIVSFVVVPGLVENIIISEVVLTEDTIQLERFEEVPFPIDFKITVWNITNVDDVLNGGMPVVTEIGPYVYNYNEQAAPSVPRQLLSHPKKDPWRPITAYQTEIGVTPMPSQPITNTMVDLCNMTSDISAEPLRFLNLVTGFEGSPEHAARAVLYTTYTFKEPPEDYRRLYQSRNITKIEGENITYTRLDRFEFDAEASFPLTEDDLVTIVNVPYHAIIQIAETQFPTLVPILSGALSSVFGENNSPIITVRTGSLFFEGIRFCNNPGILGLIACNIIADIGATAQNLDTQEDGSIIFSILAYKNGIPSAEYVVNRGVEDASRLGDIITYDNLPHFLFWLDETDGQPGVCNTIKGSDSGIFPPMVDRERSLFAINTDICRTVELRYQYDIEVDGIPTVRFAANEWFLDNNEGCYCLNVTTGHNREDGCLLEGAMELYTCVGAMLVLTYPHFLYADPAYRDGVIGVSPNFEEHRIYLDLEPNTGTPIRGSKRAQFNIFMRPVQGIPPTLNLNTTLTPIVWIEEGIDIPDEYKEELRSRLLFPLNLLDIMIPIIIVICCLVLVAGVGLLIRVKLRKPVLTSGPRTDAEDKSY